MRVVRPLPFSGHEPLIRRTSQLCKTVAVMASRFSWQASENALRDALRTENSFFQQQGKDAAGRTSGRPGRQPPDRSWHEAFSEIRMLLEFSSRQRLC